MSIVRHVLVKGRVQGVGFRAFVEHEALKHGIEGWVRNCRDGSVKVVLKGDESKVVEMIEVCRRGPMMARVDALDQRAGTDADLKARRPGEIFSVLPTA
jgi:acylphosphatase